MVSLASEFPNDNPTLHHGAIWVCLDPTGPARFVRHADVDRVDPAAPAHASLAPPEDDQEDPEAGPIVVEELEPLEASLEGAGMPELLVAAAEAITEVVVDEIIAAEVISVVSEVLVAAAEEVIPEPVVSEVIVAAAEEVIPVVSEVIVAAAEEVIPEPVVSEAIVAAAEEAIPEPAISEGVVAAAEEAIPEPAVSEVIVAAFDEEPAMAVNDASAPDTVVTPVFEEIVVAELRRESNDSSVLPPAPEDPFMILVCTLADVAIGAGSPHVASILPGLLFDGRLPDAPDAEILAALESAGICVGNEVTPAFVAVTSAWRSILRGTSDDFDSCGAAMLDEWASDLLARLLAAPARAQSLRQELRSRGVAAFGLAA